MQYSVPVLIAGGGVAGMATALSLVNRGIECLVVEPEITATGRIGETLPPHAAPILARAGIDHLMADPAHLHCYGNHFVWGDASPYEKLFFTQVHSHGWHLDRPFFEKQLRTHCIARGVEWLPGYRTAQVEQSDSGWQVAIHGPGNVSKNITCQFIVDATGRQARIARLLGQQRTRLDALVGISAQLVIDGGTLPHYTFIEAVANGWWYAAPLTGGRLSVVFMTDSDLAGKEMAVTEHFLRIGQNSANALFPDVWQKQIRYEARETTLRPASTSFLNTRTGKRWLAVGDAAYSFDPISSYGIMSALEGGYYAGHAIADTLSGAADALMAYEVIIGQAFDIYLQMHRQQYAAEQRWAGAPFWERRKRLF